MESHNVNRFPVVEGDDIVGMVTRTDFLTTIANSSLPAQGRSNADYAIRKSVLAAISQASWQPSGLNVSVREGIVSVRRVVKSDIGAKP
jgi:hypothetical protein